MIKTTYKTFLKGLAAILPLAITIYLIYWLAMLFEDVFGAALQWALGDLYIPGMGVAVGLVIILCIGFALQAWIFRRLLTLTESVLDRVPLVRAVYGSVKEVIGYLSGAASGEAQQVVMVRIPNSEMRLVGLVTRDDFSDFPDEIGDEETVAVYLPWSYQVGGFTVYMPRTAIEPTQMSVEEGLRFALTAGVSKSPRRPEKVRGPADLAGTAPKETTGAASDKPGG
ncbi:MAG: DUF502 domain-containing protein [Planctomycetota bacterium]|nr:DUF502 domain-containing protein [Planctomycetota bacterium]